MEENATQFVVDRARKRLSLFFADEIYTKTSIEEGLELGDIFLKPTEVLPYLQTALLDEKILEVELDGMTRVYFSRLHDDTPDLITEIIDGEEVHTEPDYTTGDYLKELTHLISLPIEPGMGNIHIRHSGKIIIRFFMANYAVELGCFFQDMALVRELPVLRLSYPSIGRLVRGAREFRAKVPMTYDLKILVVGKRRHGTLTTKVINISASGVSFSIKKDEQDLFRIDETRTFEFVQDGMLLVRLSGTVRHISKIRGKKGTEFVSGIQFDLVTRSLAAKVETIVAAVQRAHLKELAEIASESGLDILT